MRRSWSGGWRDWVAPVLTAVGLLGFLAVFARERRAFREAVTGWARHDLEERTALAAASLGETLAGGDYARLAEFGADCAQDGVRLTVAGPSGATLYDSHPGGDGGESIFAERRSGEFVVRLGLPLGRVLAPFWRARNGFLLAAMVGGAGVLLVFFVTYRQRVRIRELRRLEQFRRDFIADLSHEIKTPLAGIVGAADMLGDAGADVPRLVRIVRASARRLDRLSREVLSLARLERPGGGLDMRPADLGAIVAEVCSAYPQCRVSTGRAIVECDRDRVAEALENLVANALRHSGADEVWVRQQGAVVTVEDHGKGIPAADRERVFERFYRSESARSSAAEGSGLGLAIVRRIARLHGGDAFCEGVRPRGCRFVLKLRP